LYRNPLSNVRSMVFSLQSSVLPETSATIVLKRTFLEVERPMVRSRRAFSDPAVTYSRVAVESNQSPCESPASPVIWEPSAIGKWSDCETESTLATESTSGANGCCASALTTSDFDRESEVEPLDCNTLPPGNWGVPLLPVQKFGDRGTMIMFRNLPHALSRQMLVDILDQQGFQGAYDFVYLPRDMRKLKAFGYAFVNWISEGHAVAVLEHFEGFSAWPVGDRPCSTIMNSETNLASVLERLQGSAVLRPGVAAEFKPLIMQDGLLVPLKPQ